MPSLDMYLDDVDAAQLLAIYNADPDIAFIVSAGTGKWIAQRELAVVTDRSHCLWHIPSGSLPLLSAGDGPDGEVADPWLGWTELRAGARVDGTISACTEAEVEARPSARCVSVASASPPRANARPPLRRQRCSCRGS
jgi:hypothetical protein